MELLITGDNDSSVSALSPAVVTVVSLAFLCTLVLLVFVLIKRQRRKRRRGEAQGPVATGKALMVVSKNGNVVPTAEDLARAERAAQAKGDRLWMAYRRCAAFDYLYLGNDLMCLSDTELHDVFAVLGITRPPDILLTPLITVGARFRVTEVSATPDDDAQLEDVVDFLFSALPDVLVERAIDCLALQTAKKEVARQRKRQRWLEKVEKQRLRQQKRKELALSASNNEGATGGYGCVMSRTSASQLEEPAYASRPVLFDGCDVDDYSETPGGGQNRPKPQDDPFSYDYGQLGAARNTPSIYEYEELIGMDPVDDDGPMYEDSEGLYEALYAMIEEYNPDENSFFVANQRGVRGLLPDAADRSVDVGDSHYWDVDHDSSDHIYDDIQRLNRDDRMQRNGDLFRGTPWAAQDNYANGANHGQPTADMYGINAYGMHRFANDVYGNGGLQDEEPSSSVLGINRRRSSLNELRLLFENQNEGDAYARMQSSHGGDNYGLADAEGVYGLNETYQLGKDMKFRLKPARFGDDVDITVDSEIYLMAQPPACTPPSRSESYEDVMSLSNSEGSYGLAPTYVLAEDLKMRLQPMMFEHGVDSNVDSEYTLRKPAGGELYPMAKPEPGSGHAVNPTKQRKGPQGSEGLSFVGYDSPLAPPPSPDRLGEYAVPDGFPEANEGPSGAELDHSVMTPDDLTSAGSMSHSGSPDSIAPIYKGVESEKQLVKMSMAPANVDYEELDGPPDHTQDRKDALTAEHCDAATNEPDGKDMEDAYVTLPSYEPDGTRLWAGDTAELDEGGDSVLHDPDEPGDFDLALGALGSMMVTLRDDDGTAREQRAGSGGVDSNGQVPPLNAGGHDVAVDYLEAVDDTPTMHNPLYLETKDLVPATVPDYLTCIDDEDGTGNYAVPSDIITEANLTSHGGMVMETDHTHAEPPTEFVAPNSEHRASWDSASSYVTFSAGGDDLEGLNDGDVPASPIYEYAETLSPSPDASAESTPAKKQNKRRMTMWELPSEADVAEMTLKNPMSTPPAATPVVSASPDRVRGSTGQTAKQRMPAQVQASPPKGKRWSKDVKQKKKKVSAAAMPDMSGVSPFLVETYEAESTESRVSTPESAYYDSPDRGTLPESAREQAQAE